MTTPFRTLRGASLLLLAAAPLVQGINNKERAALGENVDISTPNDGDV